MAGRRQAGRRRHRHDVHADAGRPATSTVAFQVTVKERGYDDAVATSVPTADVAPGDFLNLQPPSIDGTAQVGVPLTGHKGRWTPKATIAYQWLVDSQIVPGATKRTFTPRPQDARQARHRSR